MTDLTEYLDSTRQFMLNSIAQKYSYEFCWLGRPIIQYPEDMVRIQHVIWSTKPDLIIETGIAHGGSLIFSASLLELNAACGGPADAEVVGIDIEIRPHNRRAIEGHPLVKRISMLEGSSVAPEIVAQIKAKAVGKESVIVILDSNHTHDHVLAELEAYGPLTTVGSYCIVLDTVIEDIPAAMFSDRPWGPGNNPKTAAREFLRTHSEFQVDQDIEQRLRISAALGGYLKRVR